MKRILATITIFFVFTSIHGIKDRDSLSEEEHRKVSCKIEREGGQHAVKQFEAFLEKHQPKGFEFDFSSKVSAGNVQKFDFKMKSESGINLSIQSGGFYSFELHWNMDEADVPYDIWYRFDEREKKPVNLEDYKGRSKVKVKYTSV